MAGKSRRKTILLPFISVIFVLGWILTYFERFPGNFKSIRVGVLTQQAKMGILQRQLANAIIVEREGIMLGVLGIFALTPFILFGGFPYWTYVSAGFFSVLGCVAMAHGRTRKTIIKEQLCRMSIKPLS